MGLLDFLFGCKNEAPINHSPKQTISAPTGAAKVRIIERRGKRTWLYNDEALKLDDYHGLTTWRSIRASASAYFQDDLAAIDADTISVRVIDQRSAYLPGDWTYISDDQYALVSDDIIALSLAYKDRLSDAGISEGDYVTCALSRPPQSNELALYILLTEQQDEAVKEANALKSMRRRTGMDLPAGSDCVTINIDDDKWPLADVPGRTYHSASLAMLPAKKGSSAKPHVMLSIDGHDVLELSARNTRYRSLVSHINDPISTCVVEKFDSLRNDGTHYYKVILVYMP